MANNSKTRISTINPIAPALDVRSADEVQWADSTDVIVVGILIYALLGLLSDAAVRRLEAHVLSYRRSLGS